MARQSLENYEGASADYNKGLEFKAEDRQMLINKAVASIQKKDFDAAELAFDVLMDDYPNYSMNYLTRVAMYTAKVDTAKALTYYDKSIEMYPSFVLVYVNLSIFYII